MAQGANPVNDVCGHLHDSVRSLPRFTAGFEFGDLPSNGIYFLFEKGEFSHGGERIVRVGTHTGQNNLPKRLAEHLYAKNKDRSIFRKHIGRCLLRRDNNPYVKLWEIDLTKNSEKHLYAHLFDARIQSSIEDIVSDYMIKNFSFSVIYIERKDTRINYEQRIISTLVGCEECNGSSGWLGNLHPNAKICSTGIWNIQGHNSELLSDREIDDIFGKRNLPANSA